MDKLKIGITHGDINGISYEVMLKTLEDNRILECCTPIIYGSPKVAAYHRKLIDVNLNLNLIGKAEDAVATRVNIINCASDEIKVDLGKSTPAAGEAAFVALERATQDLKEGKIDALLTAPINKNNIQSAQFNFPGHTEYLEQLFGNTGDALMILANQSIRVAVVTGHIPVCKISEQLTTEKIGKKIEQFNTSLQKDFGITKPRIAVLGLNPHAGDGGVIGSEEQEIILPAIEQARQNGMICFGPLPADGFFGTDAYTHYDGILAMYHDQGLIPFKVLAMEDGVNFTAGLPVVRTSPDHGTAYDKAGKNQANPNSLRQALYMAIDIVKQRNNHDNQ
ncbi:MAG: 4-hydroxythreonine-4-phosphate dehydrogenase PdxA [Paludibacteraceae bacterium]|jgi:4-hydroxythreonine-4-phosphate dehydrogenase|nr:4-hydroxythreonine-4-phosphate dehydrogenase PdxA [Paludibacteraceae bacterium]MEE1174711.1 4-hydroxythreonine-4-phosphate dehydrogenase PdxA [Paludibacteraceae bacterium]